MQAYLKKHGPGHASHSLKVEWEVQNRELSLQFRVYKRLTKPWLSDENYTQDWSKNWGLWNKDVVEAFLQLRSHPSDLSAPYLEIQVSPLNQPFALIVREPRKSFAPPEALHFFHEVSLENKIWSTSIKVALPSELKGEFLYAGFFACLDQEPREFYALEPNSEEAPDFHRPDLFLPLEHYV